MLKYEIFFIFYALINDSLFLMYSHVPQNSNTYKKVL